MENSNTIQNKPADIISDNEEKNQGASGNIVEAAIEKIQEEYKNFTGGSKEKAVSSYVSNIIQDFCRQDERFAEVVYQFKRTLSDCVKDVMTGVGTHVSDIDVYRKAVKFYFPNSEVEMNMTIDITGDAPSEEEIHKEAPKKQEKSKQQKKKTTKAAASTAPAAKPKKSEPPKKKEPEVIQLSLI